MEVGEAATESVYQALYTLYSLGDCLDGSRYVFYGFGNIVDGGVMSAMLLSMVDLVSSAIILALLAMVNALAVMSVADLRVFQRVLGSRSSFISPL